MAVKTKKSSKSMKALDDGSFCYFQSKPNKRGEVIRIVASVFKGSAYLKLQKFYPSEDNGLLPGKGLTLPLTMESIETFAALAEAMPQVVAALPPNEKGLKTFVKSLLDSAPDQD